MIPKRAVQKAPPEPLQVDLSLSFRFGDAPEEKVTVLDQQPVPMVGSVFDNRERIMRSFIGHLLKAGLKQPKVMREILPVLKIFGARG